MTIVMLNLKPNQLVSVPVEADLHPQNRCWHSSTSDDDSSWQLSLQPTRQILSLTVRQHKLKEFSTYFTLKLPKDTVVLRASIRITKTSN